MCRKHENYTKEYFKFKTERNKAQMFPIMVSFITIIMQSI